MPRSCCSSGLLRNWFWRWVCGGVAGPGAGGAGPGRPGCWLAGQRGEGLEGEVAGGDGLEQVVHGADEGPFGGGSGLAAYRELADAHVVLDVAVRGLGDVPAVPAGGDPVFGFQPLAHGLDDLPAPVLVPAGVLAAGGLFQVAALA